MAPDQDKNWGVTRPWMDKVMGTRLVYAGTPKEAEDRARRAKVRAAREAKQAEGVAAK
jgi:sterol desaturase/sphingolipid hydroxylase (fatty acid hydroxylase superfamily)